jgi:hypothetical protein
VTRNSESVGFSWDHHALDKGLGDLRFASKWRRRSSLRTTLIPTAFFMPIATEGSAVVWALVHGLFSTPLPIERGQIVPSLGG